MQAEPPPLQAWRRIALDSPRAWGEPPVSGSIRHEPGDFLVEERLGFEPDGGAAHVLVLVEKAEANTLFVARQLAARAACPIGDVGFAGLKDRRAIARQWFSVPAGKDFASIAGFAGDGFRVLAVHPHSRKLRRGAHAANRFRIRVRALQGDAGALDARLARIASAGVPNYFGSQRFGVEGANLERVWRWLAFGRLPRGREPRAFVLSASRSLAFNAVLGARVTAGSWSRLLPGEVVNLAGSQSVFAAQNLDDVLVARCSAGDIAPTGPLCGTGGVAPSDEAERVERTALASIEPLPGRLGAMGMRAERRALVLRPLALEHRVSTEQLELAFELPRGAFATSVLRELLDVRVPEADAE